MQISDRFGENELLVKHIRSTSSIASRSGVLDIGRIKHLAQIVDKAPELHLQILSSGKLKGQVLRINAQGLENALRGRNDGFTFFGCKKHDLKKSSAQNNGIIR
jgi:hypothetical protein